MAPRISTMIDSEWRFCFNQQQWCPIWI